LLQATTNQAIVKKKPAIVESLRIAGAVPVDAVQCSACGQAAHKPSVAAAQNVNLLNELGPSRRNQGVAIRCLRGAMVYSYCISKPYFDLDCLLLTPTLSIQPRQSVI